MAIKEKSRTSLPKQDGVPILLQEKVHFVDKVVTVEKPIIVEKQVVVEKEVAGPERIVEKPIAVPQFKELQATAVAYEVNERNSAVRYQLPSGEWGKWIPIAVGGSFGAISTGGGGGGGGTVTLDAAQYAALLADIGSRDWDLNFATDQVDASGSTVELGATTLAALETVTVLQGTSPWVVSGTVSVAEPVTVDAVDLDIRNLVFATDKVDASGSVVALDGPTLTALESITVQNGAGAAAVNIQDGGNSITVDGTVELGAASLAALETVTVLQGTSPWVVSGTVAAAVDSSKVEDALAADGATGNFMLAVRRDGADAATAGAGDYHELQVNSVGRLKVDATGSVTTTLPTVLMADDTANPTIPQSASFNMVFDGTNWDRVRSGGVTGMQGIAGAEAHDAPVTGNPVLVGGCASQVKPTDVSADGDVTRLWTTRGGRQRVYSSGRRRRGLYHANLGQSTVTAAADAATAGRWWLLNTSASVVLAVRRVTFNCVSGTALVTLTAPQVTIERMTFTGTPSGGTVTPCLRDSSDAAATGTIRTATTGITPSAGAAAHSFVCGTVLTAVGISQAIDQTWPSAYGDEEDYIILRQNQGIVVRQATAGTVADTRTMRVDLSWEEYDSTHFDIRD